MNISGANMNLKKWAAYVDYLSTYNRKTDRVLQDCPLRKFPQIREERADIRDAIDTKFLKLRIMHALNTLTDRERKVLILRFGLDSGFPMELEKIGNLFNVGRERIRSIEYKALRKLRNPQRLALIMEPDEFKSYMAKKAEERRKEEEEEEIKRKEREAYWEENRRLVMQDRLERRRIEVIRQEELAQIHTWKDEEDMMNSFFKAITVSHSPVTPCENDSNEDRPYTWDAINKRKIYHD